MKRAVVTLVRKSGEPYLDECIASIRMANVPHIMIECGSEWGEVLYEMRNVADSVAWVDSDDYVYPDVLLKAFEAMENSTVGVVYTDEAILIDNEVKYFREGDYSISELLQRPFTIHHLTLTRRNTISDRALKCIKQMKTMYDWPMRIEAALHSGVLRVPEVGYVWRRYPTQDSAVNPHKMDAIRLVEREYKAESNIIKEKNITSQMCH